MKIRAKLLVGFIVVALLCGIIGVLGIVQMSGMQTVLTNVSVNYMPTILAINDIQTQLEAIDSAVRSIANPAGFADDAWIEKGKKALADARAARDEAIKAWEATNNTPEEQRLWDTFKASLPAAAAYNDSIVALVDKARKLPVSAPQAAAPAAGRAGLPALSAQASERDAIISQIFELLSGDKRAVFDDLMAKAAKVSAYDLFVIDIIDLPKYAAAGWVLPLDKFITAQMRKELREDLKRWEEIFGDGFMAVVAKQGADGTLKFKSLKGEEVQIH